MIAAASSGLVPSSRSVRGVDPFLNPIQSNQRNNATPASRVVAAERPLFVALSSRFENSNNGLIRAKQRLSFLVKVFGEATNRQSRFRKAIASQSEASRNETALASIKSDRFSALRSYRQNPLNFVHPVVTMTSFTPFSTGVRWLFGAHARYERQCAKRRILVAFSLA